MKKQRKENGDNNNNKHHVCIPRKRQVSKKAIATERKVVKGKIIACVLHMYISACFFFLLFSVRLVCSIVQMCGNENFCVRIWWKMASYAHRALQIVCTLCIMYMKLITGTSIVFYHL